MMPSLWRNKEYSQVSSIDFGLTKSSEYFFQCFIHTLLTQFYYDSSLHYLMHIRPASITWSHVFLSSEFVSASSLIDNAVIIYTVPWFCQFFLKLFSYYFRPFQKFWLILLIVLIVVFAPFFIWFCIIFAFI